MNPSEAWQIHAEADCLFDAAEVRYAVQQMAARMQEELADRNPLIICILTGGIIPFGHLLTELNFPCQIDYVHATRYHDQNTGGELKWLAGPNISPANRTVVLVDDILDEGITLERIQQYYTDAGAAQVLTAVLAIKDRQRSSDITIDYEGLHVPDRYVYGFGMDYKSYLRNVDGIYAEKSK